MHMAHDSRHSPPPLVGGDAPSRKSRHARRTCRSLLHIAEGQAMRQVLCEGLQLIDKLVFRLLRMHDPSEGPKDTLWGIDWHRDNGHIAIVDI